jgi:hypothetical protein
MKVMGGGVAFESDLVEQCPDCQRLFRDYEAVTLDWFRVQGQLRIVEYSGDDESSSRIVAELSAIADRRRVLREALAEHVERAHPRQASASSTLT